MSKAVSSEHSGTGAAIHAAGLRKTYAGGVAALAGVDLHVEYGSVLCLLGPNGSGKTTTINILATITRPDAGEVTVAGRDLRADPAGVRERIGVAGQFVSVDDYLTGRENLMLTARLNHLSRSASRGRAGELIERFALGDFADRRAGTYSGGMRRRLDLAASIIAGPRVLLVDEPTTGLDPRSRIQVWDAVRALVAEGTGVLLTTQYLEEADQLSDDIVILDQGRVVAEGTPAELKKLIGGTMIEVSFPDERTAAAAGGVLAHCEHRVDGAVLHVSGFDDAEAALPGLVSALVEARLPLSSVQLTAPTLDDVFLELTGSKG